MAYQAFLEAGKEHGWFLADNRPFLETLLGTDIASKVPITGENKGIKKEEGSKEVGGSERDKERKIKEDKEAKVVEIIEDEEEDIVPPKRRPVQYVYGATDDTAYDNEEMEVSRENEWIKGLEERMHGLAVETEQGEIEIKATKKQDAKQAVLKEPVAENEDEDDGEVDQEEGEIIEEPEVVDNDAIFEDEGNNDWNNVNESGSEGEEEDDGYATANDEQQEYSDSNSGSEGEIAAHIAIMMQMQGTAGSAKESEDQAAHESESDEEEHVNVAKKSNSRAIVVDSDSEREETTQQLAQERDLESLSEKVATMDIAAPVDSQSSFAEALQEDSERELESESVESASAVVAILSDEETSTPPQQADAPQDSEDEEAIPIKVSKRKVGRLVMDSDDEVAPQVKPKPVIKAKPIVIDSDEEDKENQQQYANVVPKPSNTKPTKSWTVDDVVNKFLIDGKTAAKGGLVKPKMNVRRFAADEAEEVGFVDDGSGSEEGDGYDIQYSDGDDDDSEDEDYGTKKKSRGKKYDYVDEDDEEEDDYDFIDEEDEFVEEEEDEVEEVEDPLRTFSIPTKVPTQKTPKLKSGLAHAPIPPLAHPVKVPKTPQSRRGRNFDFQIARVIFDEFNERALDGRLPKDLPISWSVTLQTTAGRCISKRRGTEYTCEIELSIKVLDTLAKLRSTLAHEMCHALQWLVDHSLNPPHGRVFYSWAKLIERKYPDLKVSTCHSYKINYKYQYVCTNKSCARTVGRHSKSLDLDRKVCAACGSRFQLAPRLLKDGTPAKTKAPSAFSVFLKSNLAQAKKENPSTPHKEVMAMLSQKYREMQVK